MGEIGGCGEWDAFVCDRFWRMKEFGGGDAVNPLLQWNLSEMENWRMLRIARSQRNYLA